jgi:predicted GNAT family acetyltransferase
MEWTVRHEPEAHRFVASLEGGEATIAYETDADGTLDLVHTFVPPDLRGHGVADELARQSLSRLKEEGTPFRLTCPFLRAYVLRHPELGPAKS